MAGEVTVDTLHLFNRNRATVISILALCAYEYTITLYDEIQYVWRHKYTFATVLFAFNRYAVWVETCFLLYLAFGDLTTIDQCTSTERALSVFIVCHKLCIGLFCAFRLYAIWDRKWNVFWVILLLYVAQSALFLTPNVLSEYVPLGPPFDGCTIAERTLGAQKIIQLQLASNGLTIVSDAMILGLTVMKTIRISADSHRLGLKTPITNLLLRDGTVYFVALTTLSTTNIIALKMGPTSPIFGTITLFIPQLRGILVSRFFLNLRHVFFKKGKNSPESPSSVKIKIPMIPSEDLVGNLGAPLRSSSITGLRASPSPGPSRQRKSRVGADPLQDWGADDDDDPDDVEITSHRPMLVGLDIDSDMMGEGTGLPLWRKELGTAGEEVTSLIGRNGKNIAVRSPVRSTHPHPKVEGDEESLPPSRQPSKSTVEEDDALLVDADWDLDSSLRYPPRVSIASTVNSDPREVTPRRTSYFS